MASFIGYYDRFRDLKSDVTGLPRWARTVFTAFCLPGIVLVALSILALIASVVALLAIGLPAYMLLRAVTRPAGGRQGQADLVTGAEWPTGPAKHVEARVREADSKAPDEVNGE